MVLQELYNRRKISIFRLKQEFAAKYPNSPILKILLTLPDEIDSLELIGEAFILLKILDTKENNLFISNTRNNKEGYHGKNV